MHRVTERNKVVSESVHVRLAALFEESQSLMLCHTCAPVCGPPGVFRGNSVPRASSSRSFLEALLHIEFRHFLD